MKRIALLCCLMCAFVTGNALVIINAQVHFGKKKYGCERGVGICVLQLDSRNESSERTIRLSLSPDSRNLLIEFPDALMEQFPQQFLNGVFVQEEDFQIPEEIQRGIGVSEFILIPAGKYPLLPADGWQRISISLVL